MFMKEVVSKKTDQTAGIVQSNYRLKQLARNFNLPVMCAILSFFLLKMTSLKFEII